MKRSLLLFVFSLLLPLGGILMAQDNPTLHADPATGIPLGKTTLAQPEANPGEEMLSYRPKIDGVVKARFEISTLDGEYRFNVRNSRFGLSGNVTKHLFYRMQVDFSNEGNLNVLDAHAGFREGRWSITLGQQRTLFSTDFSRGPADNLFINRSMVAKFIVGYYGADLIEGIPVEYVRSLGSRDLGAVGTYSWPMCVPMKFYLGLFNGSGVNNPEWSSSINLMGRIEAGNADAGLRLALSYYHGTLPSHSVVYEEGGELYATQPHRYIRMVNVELRYTQGNFFVEGEYVRRYLERYAGSSDLLTAVYVHSFYRFKIPSCRQLSYIAPVLRWDIGNGIDYMNRASLLHETVDVNRITAGINFGFGPRMTRSEVRINYDKYLFGKKPCDHSINKLFQDKIAIELVVAF